jgi:hypothetical protein
VIQKQKNNNSFQNLDKIRLSDDLKMKRILVKKRKDKEESRLFYENGNKVAALKAKIT